MQNITTVLIVGGNKLIWIQKIQFVKMLDESFLWYPKETGGLLAGFVDTKGNIVVSVVTESGPAAAHNNMSYIPDYSYDERQIEQLYLKSSGELTYLGDWHSHPKFESYMSNQDFETLYNIGQSGAARIPSPVMMILGTNPFDLKAWQLTENRIEEIQVALF